jgi:hypothetical protein
MDKLEMQHVKEFGDNMSAYEQELYQKEIQTAQLQNEELETYEPCELQEMSR